MASAPEFADRVPGFEFLQSLMKNAGAGLPDMGQWIAPTLDPERLDGEIQKLRTVQFWLEQNAKLLATTVQALEVQRMTLSTLRSMNLPLNSLSDVLQAAHPAPPSPAAKAPPRRSATAGEAPAAAAPLVDTLQWWGALTQQFTEIATQAMRDRASDAAREAAASRPEPAGAGAAPAPPSKPRATRRRR